MTNGAVITAIALVGLLAGFLLILAARAIRRRRGLGAGATISLDRVTLTSRRLGLSGRPDRLVKAHGTIIPEEWKSSRRLWPNHRVQMGVYFLLIEDQLGFRPPHGFIVTGDGTRHRIDNDDSLRAWVLELAGQIRAARQVVGQPLPVIHRPEQCRSCGKRDRCGQTQL